MLCKNKLSIVLFRVYLKGLKELLAENINDFDGDGVLALLFVFPFVLGFYDILLFGQVHNLGIEQLAVVVHINGDAINDLLEVLDLRFALLLQDLAVLKLQLTHQERRVELLYLHSELRAFRRDLHFALGVLLEDEVFRIGEDVVDFYLNTRLVFFLEEVAHIKLHTATDNNNTLLVDRFAVLTDGLFCEVVYLVVDALEERAEVHLAEHAVEREN